MQTLSNDMLNFVDTIVDEFDGQDIYGLEFVVDDLKQYEPSREELESEASADFDWFGLSDLTI